MAREKPWLKLWVDSLLGLKSLDLSLAETGAWWKLYAFGHYLGQSGRLTRENNRPYALPAIMEALRITKRADMATFQHMVDKQLDSGLLRWEGQVLAITGYDDEQSRAPSAQKEAVRDRVQRWRAAQKDESVTDSPLPDAAPQPQSVPGTPETGNGNVTGVTALPSVLSSVSALEDLSFDSFLSTCREVVSSIIHHTRDTQSQHDQILAWLAEYGGGAGFKVGKEYSVPEGRIDLVWLVGDEVVAGFEVDHRTPKAKSMVKLGGLDAPWKCIILRSEREAFVEEQGIQVIELTGELSAGVTEQALVAELSRCYEADIGLLSGTTRELFEEFLEEYHGPVGWIAEAFKEAVKYGHRNWAYIRKILMNWQEQGRRDESHGRQTKRDETPERDPLAGARESGWKVRTVREHEGPDERDAD